MRILEGAGPLVRRFLEMAGKMQSVGGPVARASEGRLATSLRQSGTSAPLQKSVGSLRRGRSGSRRRPKSGLDGATWHLSSLRSDGKATEPPTGSANKLLRRGTLVQRRQEFGGGRRGKVRGISPKRGVRRQRLCLGLVPCAYDVSQ